MSNSKLEANEQQFSTKEVRIVPYDPQWKAEFEKIKAMIQSYIGEYVEKEIFRKHHLKGMLTME